MSNKIKVEISPLQFYNRYASSDYILCGLDFYITQDGKEYHFRSQSSNNCLRELINEMDDFLSGNLPPETNLVYYIPWILGDYCVYPYSFHIKNSNTWSFRYKRNQNDPEFDFECDLIKDDIIFLLSQLKSQFAAIDWPSLGKTELYAFDFPKTEFEWCYSANSFCKKLNELCVGHSINRIFISAVNYADPLRIDENLVNYYLGSEVIIEFDEFLIDLLILAEGLFRWRVFKNSEYLVCGPTNKFIEDGDKEFCDIGNVYGMFSTEYANNRIVDVEIDSTDCWAWDAKGFDKKTLSDPIELPKTVFFRLSNGYILSFEGLMDDFLIRLFKP